MNKPRQLFSYFFKEEFADWFYNEISNELPHAKGVAKGGGKKMVERKNWCIDLCHPHEYAINNIVISIDWQIDIEKTEKYYYLVNFYW